MVLLVLTTLVVAAGAVLLSRAVAPAGRAARLVAVLVFVQAVVVVSGLIAGTVLRITGPTLSATATVLGIGMAVLGCRMPSSRWRHPTSSTSTVPVVAVSGALTLAVLQHGWRTYQAVKFPVLDWDGLSYHLVTVDVWLQSGRIGAIPQRIWSDGYPATGELLTLWLVGFTRTDTLADLTSVVTVPLLITGTALLARELGAGRATAAFAGAVASLVPAVVVLSSTTYVDVPAAAAAIAGLGLLLTGVRSLEAAREHPVARRSTRLVIWIAAGSALGLAAGTKTTTMVLVVFAGVGASAIVAHRWEHSDVQTADRLPLAVAAAITLALGGFWYIDNLVSHGNPFYPIALGPFAGPVSPEHVTSVNLPESFEQLGTMGRVLESWIADLRDGPIAYDVRPGGFGWLWPTLLLPSAVVWIVAAALRRRWVAMVVVVVPLVLSTAINPMPWWARLTITLTSFGAATFAAVATHVWRSMQTWPRGPRAVTAGVATVAILATMAGNAWMVSRTTNHPGRVGPDPERVLTIAEVYELSRRSAEELRQIVSPWSSCSALEELPGGTRVTTTGVTHPHLLVGHDFARVLAPPLPEGLDSPAELERAIRERELDYIILEERRPVNAVAARSPALQLVARGVCGERFPALSIYRTR